MSPARKPAIVDVHCYECGHSIEWLGGEEVMRIADSPEYPTWEHKAIDITEDYHEVLPVFMPAR